MKMRKKTIVRLFCLLLAIALFNFPIAVQAQEIVKDYTNDTEQTYLLDNGDKIVIKTHIQSLARSTNVKKFKDISYKSNNVTLCTFTIYGVFDTSTRKCLSSSYENWSSGGAWRPEESKVWHDTYTVYGSTRFTKRVLGIKIDSTFMQIDLSY